MPHHGQSDLQLAVDPPLCIFPAALSLALLPVLFLYMYVQHAPRLGGFSGARLRTECVLATAAFDW